MKSKFRTYKQTELLPNMLKESEVQKQVMQYLVLCGYLVVRINSGAFVDGKRFIRAYRIENNGKSKFQFYISTIKAMILLVHIS